MSTRIAIAVSGGIDSLLALVLLREQGHDLLALHGRLLPLNASGEAAVAGLANLCCHLRVPFKTLDLTTEFEHLVIKPFAAAYAAGLTPNPCARCNAVIKFGLIMDAALAEGAECLTTGHYARRIDHFHYGQTLSYGADLLKEQSYFLALVPPGRLARAVFPLGRFTKAAVRAALIERGLFPPLPNESQEICFVSKDDYRSFLERHNEKCGTSLPGPGSIQFVDGRKLGRHHGLWRYTVGQRRGLGLPFAEPLYVVGKNIKTNSLLVGPRPTLATSSCRVGELNLLVPPEYWPKTVLVRTHYRQKADPAVTNLSVTASAGDVLEVNFLTPSTMPAPGQVAAIYAPDGAVLAGGILLPQDPKAAPITE
ncbi:tRNA-specific 2-thiouridylase MnmA [Desulfovibrionales bacterium]